MAFKNIDIIEGHPCAIYDDGPKYTDRYIIVVTDWIYPDKRYCCLFCSHGGRAYSEWADVETPSRGHWNRRRIAFADLDKATQNHIRARIRG